MYVFVVLWRFPAALAAHWFAPDTLTLYGVSGSVWNGRAAAVSAGSNVTLGATDWTIGPLWLLTGRVKGTFGTGLDASSRIQSGFSKPFVGDGFVLSDLQGIVDLSALPSDLRMNGATGRIGLAFDRVQLDAMWLDTLEGSVSIVQLALSRPRAIDLGTFELTFDGQSSDPIIGLLSDTASDISIEGTLSLGLDRTWVLDARALAGPNADRDVRDALPLLGAREADGRTALSFSGTVSQ